MNNKKITTLVGAAIAAALFLTGCGAEQNETPTAIPTVTATPTTPTATPTPAEPAEELTQDEIENVSLDEMVNLEGGLTLTFKGTEYSCEAVAANNPYAIGFKLNADGSVRNYACLFDFGGDFIFEG